MSAKWHVRPPKVKLPSSYRKRRITLRRYTRSRLVVISAVSVLAITVASAISAGASQSSSHHLHTKAISAKRCAANRKAGPMTFVSPFLYDASAGIIDVVDAKALGYFAQMCISVNIVVPSQSLSPYELVSAGKGTITGEGSAADTMIGTSGGANLVAIATLADTSDYAILTKPSVSNLKQLDGKVLAYHTVLPVVLSEMLKKGGANLAQVHEINDTSYDPTILFSKSLGISALQAYQSNEPFSLQAAGYRLGKAFREWTPAQLGVKGTFNVQVVNRTFLQRHPNTVADFLRAELHALDYCLSHETACVTLEQRIASAAGYPGSTTHALAEWRFEASLVRHHALPGKGIGIETVGEWTPEAKALVQFHLLSHLPLISRVENTTIAAHLYHGTKLIWPGP